jgi:hypothetical protein
MNLKTAKAIRPNIPGPFLLRADTISAPGLSRTYTCAKPPSTNSSVPVTKLLSSDARNSTALAISSGVPNLPSGTVRWTHS